MNQIKLTAARPTREGRLSLEITFESGRTYHFDVDRERFYESIAEILRVEKPQRLITEPEERVPSSFTPQQVASPS
jgi:hypothetical protein